MISSYITAIRYRLWVLRNKNKFREFGKRSFFKSPLAISGHGNISIGNEVLIGYKSWISCVPLTNATECLLQISDGCVIGNFNHIYATRKVVFGKKVLTADKVYISDNSHGYIDINLPIMEQSIVQKGEVLIGDGSWIGENVCILGATIGRNCVIGANSVVTKNIRDYSVAVGNPARIVKRYCMENNTWRQTTPEGDFI